MWLLQVVAAQQAVAARAEAEAAQTALAVAEVRHEYDTRLAAAMRAMQDSHAERCSLLEQDMEQAVQVSGQSGSSLQARRNRAIGRLNRC